MPIGSAASPLLLLALAVPAATAPDRVAPPQPPEGRVEIAQLTIHEHIVIRLPRMADPAVQPATVTTANAPMPIRWREKKGPHCIAANSLAGAMLSSPRQLDLVLAGGRRVRARLGGACQPLDFYSGFYLRPDADGQVCAGRDAIRVRSGGACDIDQFRRLVPAKK